MIERQSYEDDFPLLFDRLRERHFADSPKTPKNVALKVFECNRTFWDQGIQSTRIDRQESSINDIFPHPKLQFTAHMSGSFEEGFRLGVDDARTLADACVAYLSQHFEDLTPEQQYVVRHLHQT